MPEQNNMGSGANFLIVTLFRNKSIAHIDDEMLYNLKSI